MMYFSKRQLVSLAAFISFMLCSVFCAAAGNSSTVLAPITTTPYYPGNANTAVSGVQYNVPQISNANYASLPACPTTQSPGPWSSTAPTCPSLNLNFPSTPGSVAWTTAYNNSSNNYSQMLSNWQFFITNYGGMCPSLCTVTRQVTNSGASPVSVVDAVCPVGYHQVASYNMQQEIAPLSAQLQNIAVIDAAHWLLLSSIGYSCSNGVYYTQLNLCTPWVQVGGNVPTSGIVPVGYAYQNYDQTIGRMAWYYPVANSYNGPCYRDAYCHYSDGNCYPGGSYQYYRWNVYVGVCSCTTSLCYTQNKAPASVVCSRDQQTWQTQ